MKNPLDILHLEDNAGDAELILHTLEAGGIHCKTTRVESREDFVAALEQHAFDLVLSDFSLPSFDGLSALKIAQSTHPDLPLIIVSGTLGEERAVDSIKSGATDYVLKDHVARLVPAVRRAMQDVKMRTERRLLEAQFIEAQKMEVLGQLAGGVAHDFNNLLAVIMGYSHLLSLKLGADSPLRSFTEEIHHASERAAGLTRQLLIFSRKQTVQATVLDLNDVAKSLENMLQRLIDENINLNFVCGKNLGHVKADSGYIGQVLMNLVVNARDAMPTGGKLTITTENITLDDAYAATHKGATPGDYVMLSVSDTGTGMSDQVKARLFEPFFTTKPLGKGTGLGLPTCQTIVHQSGGHIDIASEIGNGTTFKIYLPCVHQPLDVSTHRAPIGSITGGSETLLVVEDEPAVRHLARSVLETLGYQVLTASNGQDALHVARDHQNPAIQLVITDIVMPLMGGKVMAEWLQTTDPDLKILFTSGYTDDAMMRNGVQEEGVEFLAKPYTPATLASKVREMLDNEPVPQP